jgi:hypothetical protein
VDPPGGGSGGGPEGIPKLGSAKCCSLLGLAEGLRVRDDAGVTLRLFGGMSLESVWRMSPMVGYASGIGPGAALGHVSIVCTAMDAALGAEEEEGEAGAIGDGDDDDATTASLHADTLFLGQC